MIVCDHCHTPLSDGQPSYGVGIYGPDDKPVDQASWTVHCCRSCAAELKKRMAEMLSQFKKRFIFVEKPKE